MQVALLWSQLTQGNIFSVLGCYNNLHMFRALYIKRCVHHWGFSAPDILFCLAFFKCFLISQLISMLLPFVGIVSSRRFHQMVTTRDSVLIIENMAENFILWMIVICSSDSYKMCISLVIL